MWACMQAEKVTSNVQCILQNGNRYISSFIKGRKREVSGHACMHAENVVCQFITDIGRYNSSHDEAV